MVCDARYAAEACLNALWRLRPPRLLGRVAFSHDQSETGLPMMDSMLHGSVELQGRVGEMAGWAGPQYNLTGA